MQKELGCIGPCSTGGVLEAYQAFELEQGCE